MTHRQGDLIHFWKCRRQALDQLLANVTPPVEARSFRQAHELYLLYLHSLLDLANDMEDECGSVETRWRDALQGLGNLDGTYNASYLRELRNSAIKRGIDVTGAGQVADGQTCALSMIVHNKGGTQSYRPFDPWLRNIFCRAELALTPAIKPLVERLIEEAQGRTDDALARTARRGVVSADLCPSQSSNWH